MISARPVEDTIRVHVLDGLDIVRQGVKLLLQREAEFEVVADSGSLAEALAASREADVMLIDPVLGDTEAVEAVAALHERFPHSMILVLTTVGDPGEVRAALAAGAMGFILKDVSPSELFDAVRRVARREHFLQPSLGATMAAQPASPARERRRARKLSPREREILKLIAAGHTNTEIARLLGIAVRTVETHRAHILEKLGVRTRADLVRYASEAGLSSNPEEGTRSGR